MTDRKKNIYPWYLDHEELKYMLRIDVAHLLPIATPVYKITKILIFQLFSYFFFPYFL